MKNKCLSFSQSGSVRKIGLRSYLLLVLSLLVNRNYAQQFTERPEFIKANSHWIFPEPYPYGTGIDFTSGLPKAIFPTIGRGGEHYSAV